MPIKFKCPGCQKGLTVKDELAGKKATCPACRTPLTIPAPGSNANLPALPKSAPATVNGGKGKVTTAENDPPRGNVEDLAASLLAEVPNKVETPQFVEFTCPLCDSPIKVGMDLAGKQTPCPECRRIVKVPVPQAKKEADWRQADRSLPSGARQNLEQPAPEGAWGVGGRAQRVSVDALEEAGALPEQREPLTARKIILRSVMGVSGVALLVISVMLILNLFTAGKAKKLLAESLQYTTGEGGKERLGDEAAAALLTAAGEFHLRRNERDCVKPEKGDEGAWNQFTKARTRLAGSRASGGAVSPESELVLFDLALAQINLAGDKKAIEERMRLDWTTTSREVAQTLALIKNPELRREALRLTARRILALGQPKIAALLPSQVVPMQALRTTREPGSAAPPRLSSEGPEALAVVALELWKANQQDEARNLLAQIQAVYPNDKKLEGQMPLLVPEVIALYTLAGQSLPPLKETPETTRVAGTALALALQGKAEEARTLAGRVNAPLSRYDALLALALGAGDKESAESASRLATNELANQALSPWTMLALVLTDLQGGVPEETTLALANRIREPAVQGWAQLALVRDRLSKAPGKVEDSAIGVVEAKTLAQGLAHLTLAEHNVRHESGMTRQVETWDEGWKPFGYAGLALGLQSK